MATVNGSLVCNPVIPQLSLVGGNYVIDPSRSWQLSVNDSGIVSYALTSSGGLSLYTIQSTDQGNFSMGVLNTTGLLTLYPDPVSQCSGGMYLKSPFPYLWQVSITGGLMTLTPTSFFSGGGAFKSRMTWDFYIRDGRFRRKFETV